MYYLYNWTIKISLFLLITICFMADSPYVSAAEMRIHAIHLTDKNGENSLSGDAVLLESHKRYLLMDTGLPETSASLIQYLKKRKVRHFDIYISHLHRDHYGGLLAILRNRSFHVCHIYFPVNYGQCSSSIKKEYNELLSAVMKKKKKFTYISPGYALRLGDATLKVLGPVGKYSEKNTVSINELKNSYSMTTMVTCGKIKYLSTGDITAKEEKLLIKYYRHRLHADIMKSPHHGDPPSNAEDWLYWVSPSYIFSCSAVSFPVTKFRTEAYSCLDVTAVLDKNIIYDINNNKIKVTYKK